MSPQTIARLFVTAFFAIVFVQSGLDKLVDREGNLEYFRDHFKGSPFSAETVLLLLRVLMIIELLAGGLCALGVLFFSFRHTGLNLASLGVTLSAFALLCLLFGQRVAKDYAGAAVVAAYFAVALIGLALF